MTSTTTRTRVGVALAALATFAAPLAMVAPAEAAEDYPRAQISPVRYLDKGSVTVTRLINRTNQPATFEVVTVTGRNRFRSEYVTVQPGEVARERRVNRTNRAHRVVARYLDAKAAARLMPPSHQVVRARAGYDAFTFKIVNRTNRVRAYTVDVLPSQPSHGGDVALPPSDTWHVTVPADSRLPQSVAIDPGYPTRVAVRRDARTLLNREVWGMPNG